MQIREFLKTRPLSWSAISSFEYNPDDWYDRYILGVKKPDTKEMIFGKKFAESIENGEPMAPVTILSAVEHRFSVVFNGIPMIGFADTFCTETMRRLGEYKTSRTGWDQARVDEHGQITLYALFNFVTNGVPPEDVDFFLEYVATEETGDFNIRLKDPVKVHHFDTKRTTADIIRFGKRIMDVVDAMQAHVDMKEKLSPSVFAKQV